MISGNQAPVDTWRECLSADKKFVTLTHGRKILSEGWDD
jgi:hypothetical protein